MILPSKIFRYEETIISKIPIVLKEIDNGNTKIASLLECYTKKFTDNDISDFINLLEILYILDCIELDVLNGSVSHAERD